MGTHREHEAPRALHVHRLTALLGGMLLAAALAGCGTSENDGGTDAGGTVEPNLASIQANIFQGCTLPSCHDSDAPKRNLDLTSAAKSCEQMVGVPAQTLGAMAQDLLRVKAGDSANSFLYQKIATDMANLGNYMDDIGLPLGERMPQRLDKLPDAQIKAIKDWIDSGAKCK